MPLTLKNILIVKKMDDIKLQLQEMERDQKKKSNGVNVEFGFDGFEIGGYAFNLDDAVEKIKKDGKQKKGSVYNRIAFTLSKPASGCPGVVVSTHIVKNKEEHAKLIDDAIARGLYLWHGNVEEWDGRYYIKHPLFVNWSTVDKFEESKANKAVKTKEITQKRGEFDCPYCNKKLNSSSGRTLHVKSSHSDRLEEYSRTQF